MLDARLRSRDFARGKAEKVGTQVAYRFTTETRRKAKATLFLCLAGETIFSLFVLLFRLWATGWGNDSIHPQIFDHLAVVVKGMCGGKRTHTEAGCFHVTEQRYLV